MYKRNIKENPLLRSRFFRSMNFRIMLFLFLIGTIPEIILSWALLSSYEKQSLTRLGNDVSNQYQILATRLGSGN